ncbi:UNKNOWN [Stylonychia lemnae]|uniref:Uncharacterized protein n=1 Tax=Stylonychia lemnae TaxID=5949 RepID=A0A078AZ61_STYLE|nr:UNKNOWN [Stylonychia lemnae]|eukprot:CDW86103.1 UNKNOWN [Stylonychia lemnae]
MVICREANKFQSTLDRMDQPIHVFNDQKFQEYQENQLIENDNSSLNQVITSIDQYQQKIQDFLAQNDQRQSSSFLNPRQSVTSIKNQSRGSVQSSKSINILDHIDNEKIIQLLKQQSQIKTILSLMRKEFLSMSDELKFGINSLVNIMVKLNDNSSSALN